MVITTVSWVLLQHLLLCNLFECVIHLEQFLFPNLRYIILEHV